MAVVVCLALAVACTGREAAVVIDIATTTSVQNSGLLDALLPQYTRARIRVHAAGSGRALRMFEEGVVRVVISHAPEAEARYLASHPEWTYRKIAFNGFALVGPAADPADVRGAPDVRSAFQRIAASKTFFVSRGDQSGTHERELSLWQDAGVAMPVERLIVSGSSMAVALRHAEEKQAYTLSDEATFWQLEQQLSIVELRAGDAALLNTYAVIHGRDDEAASAFAEWLTTGPGRDAIGRFEIRGRQGFTPWRAGCPGDTPSARPCV